MFVRYKIVEFYETVNGYDGFSIERFPSKKEAESKKEQLISEYKQNRPTTWSSDKERNIRNYISVIGTNKAEVVK